MGSVSGGVLISIIIAGIGYGIYNRRKSKSAKTSKVHNLDTE
jgi:hypothetical protein